MTLQDDSNSCRESLTEDLQRWASSSAVLVNLWKRLNICWLQGEDLLKQILFVLVSTLKTDTKCWLVWHEHEFMNSKEIHMEALMKQ